MGNYGSGGGFNFTGPQTQGPAAGTITGGNNGVSRSTIDSTKLVLGNDVGEAGSPAQLISSREIALAGFVLSLLGNFFNVVFNPGSFDLTDTSGTDIQQTIPGTHNWKITDTGIVSAPIILFDFFGKSALFDLTGAGGILGAAFTLLDDDNTRDVGQWTRHDARTGTWDGQRIQNRSANAAARTQFRALNDQSDLNKAAELGMGSNAQTTYPNTAYLQARSGTTALYIAALNSAGFIAFSTTAEGAAGEKMRLIAAGRLGIGVTAPTATLHPKAGVAAASGAPFKYNAGVLAQTAVEDGAKNFDGTNESIAAGGVTYILAKTLTNTASLDFPNTAAQNSSDLTITVTGAAVGDVVLLGVDNASVNANSCYTAFVSAANTVTVRFNNYSAAAIDPAAGTFRVSIVKY